MTPRLLLCAVLLALPALTACGNGGASEPPVTSYDPAATSKLQFAVGVATIASDNGQSIAYGLNTVLTLRQSDGLSGVLYSQPQIVGPAKFSVLTSTQTGSQVQYAGADLGTNHITWATLNQSNWTGPLLGLKAPSTGAFGYGLCPCNSDAGPVNGSAPLYQAMELPVYGSVGDLERFFGGPPAFAQVDYTVRNLGFLGYSLGFTDFAVQPVLGTYHLYAAVPPAFTTPANPTPSPNPNGSPSPPPGIFSASAQLSSLQPLPPMATPAFTADGKGGGSIAVTVPPGVTEAMVEVYVPHASGIGAACLSAHSADAYATLFTSASGTQKLTLADNAGPVMQNGGTSLTICPGGSYDVYAVGFDYPAYEASYPKNLSQTPTISGRNGQANVTTSAFFSGRYPR